MSSILIEGKLVLLHFLAPYFYHRSLIVAIYHLVRNVINCDICWVVVNRHVVNHTISSRSKTPIPFLFQPLRIFYATDSLPYMNSRSEYSGNCKKSIRLPVNETMIASSLSTKHGVCDRKPFNRKANCFQLGLYRTFIVFSM
jgi:hypothetical protein